MDGIVRYARDYSPEGDAALLATGEQGLGLLLDAFLYEADGPWPLGTWPTGRDGIDRFNRGVGLLAAEHPDVFIERVANHRLPHNHQRSMVAVTLSELGRPDAAHLLCRFLRDRDWIIRLHAVRGIGRLANGQPQPCVNGVLRDKVSMVQLQAIRTVSRWDPERAMTLYRRFLKQGRFLRNRRPSPPWTVTAAQADLTDLIQGKAPPDRL